MPQFELSVVMPCLNEEETLARCIDKAKLGFERAGVKGEVIVADNGSTDRSREIAQEHGARLVPVTAKGYGSALRGGIEAADSEWIIMGDADDSYDFSDSAKFVQLLREGNDLVMGCRMPRGGGTIAPGAMPWKNRYIGNPILSFIGRLFFKTPIQDFHCGMRGFTKSAYRRMELKTTGMEFASEMVMKAGVAGLKVAEVPITLHKDGRSRPPHLRPWRDGWRHLRFMLIYSPRWLFLVPGLVLGLLGGLAALYCLFTPFEVAAEGYPGLGNPGSPAANSLLIGLLVSCACTVAGLQLVSFAFFTKVFGLAEGLLPEDNRFTRIFRLFTLERGLIGGVLAFVFGLVWLLRCLLIHQFSPVLYTGGLSAEEAREISRAALNVELLRQVAASTTLLVLSIQTIFSSFFMSVLGLKTVTRRPPDPGVV